MTSQLKNPRLTPRLRRLALALLSAPEGLAREAADKATPASNSPHYVCLLRERLGAEIPCELRPFVTRDGESGKFGIYHLTPTDRKRLSAALY